MVINLSQYLIALLREKMLLREKIRSILNGAFHCSVGFFVVLHHIFGFIFHRWILNVFDHFNTRNPYLINQLQFFVTFA